VLFSSNMELPKSYLPRIFPTAILSIVLTLAADAHGLLLQCAKDSL
jgi:hypothetical protein